MPIYEYLCTACDHRADILHGINDPAPQFCLSCGSAGTMRKLFAVPSIHYKGSGWAKKDRGGSSARASAAASGSATSAESSSTSADAKGTSDSGGASSGPAASSGTGE